MNINGIQKAWNSLPPIYFSMDNPKFKAAEAEFAAKFGVPAPVIRHAGWGQWAIGLLVLGVVAYGAHWMGWWGGSDTEEEEPSKVIDLSGGGTEKTIPSSPSEEGNGIEDDVKPKKIDEGQAVATLGDVAKPDAPNAPDVPKIQETLNDQVIIGEYGSNKKAAEKAKNAILGEKPKDGLNRVGAGSKGTITARSRDFNSKQIAADYRDVLIRHGVSKSIAVQSNGDLYFVQYGAYKTSSAADEAQKKIDQILAPTVERENGKYYLLLGKSGAARQIKALDDKGAFDF